MLCRLPNPAFSVHYPGERDDSLMTTARTGLTETLSLFHFDQFTPVFIINLNEIEHLFSSYLTIVHFILAALALAGSTFAHLILGSVQLATNVRMPLHTQMTIE